MRLNASGRHLFFIRVFLENHERSCPRSLPLRNDDHFQPVFHVDEDGQLDPLSSLILNFFRGWALIVVIGGPLWAISMIPTYLDSWQTRPGFTGGVTQCFLAVFAPMFLGLARACRVSNQRRFQMRVRVSQILALSIGLLGLAALIGLAIWDFTRLDDFLAYYQRNPSGATTALIFIGSSVLGGLVLGWYVGRSYDQDLRRFQEQIRKELEVRRQRHA